MQVYEPQEDSFLLEETIKKFDLSNTKCLDLGTGSGIQARAMFDAGSRNIFCVDINYKALLKSQQKNSDIKESIKLVESDLFSSLQGEEFDFIAFNPPYLPSDDIKWKDLDGGKKGREVIDKFISQVAKHLIENGEFLLLVSSLNKEKEIVKELKKMGFEVNIIAEKKLFYEVLYIIHSVKAKSEF
jgi:release factor glutamine methyltransferase